MNCKSASLSLLGDIIASVVLGRPNGGRKGTESVAIFFSDSVQSIGENKPKKRTSEFLSKQARLACQPLVIFPVEEKIQAAVLDISEISAGALSVADQYQLTDKLYTLLFSSMSELLLGLGLGMDFEIRPLSGMSADDLSALGIVLEHESQLQPWERDDAMIITTRSDNLTRSALIRLDVSSDTILTAHGPEPIIHTGIRVLQFVTADNNESDEAGSETIPAK